MARSGATARRCNNNLAHVQSLRVGAEFERAVICERTSAGLQAARERGKKGGRPKTFGPKELAAAKALLADPEIRVTDIAARLNVSPATLYRYIPGGRSGLDTNT